MNDGECFNLVIEFVVQYVNYFKDFEDEKIKLVVFNFDLWI